MTRTFVKVGIDRLNLKPLERILSLAANHSAEKFQGLTISEGVHPLP